jgi:hypothetical protein
VCICVCVYVFVCVWVCVFNSIILRVKRVGGKGTY